MLEVKKRQRIDSSLYSSSTSINDSHVFHPSPSNVYQTTVQTTVLRQGTRDGVKAATCIFLMTLFFISPLNMVKFMDPGLATTATRGNCFPFFYLFTFTIAIVLY